MCGVAGYIGEPIREGGFLRRLLLEMKTRGRDGFGFLTYNPIEKEKVTTFKRASEVSHDKLEKAPAFEGATAVLMHTRQATSGTHGPIDCHPLTHKGVTIVHNGVVTQHERLRRELGVPEDSPTVDSFLVAWLIGEAKNIPEGIEKVFKTLNGSLTFLTFSSRSPMTIWAASNNGVLHQFKHKGQDYLCSTERIFDDALTTRSAKRVKRGGYRSFGPLNGVWELSPYTFKQTVTAEEITKMEPAWTAPVVRGWGEDQWSDTAFFRKDGKHSKNRVRSRVKATRSNPYLVPPEEKAQFQLSPYVRGLDIVSTNYTKLCRKQLLDEAQNEIVMEGLTLKLMPHVVRAIDTWIISMIDSSTIVDCVIDCGRKAKVVLNEESQNLCWTCAAVYNEWDKEEPKVEVAH